MGFQDDLQEKINIIEEKLEQYMPKESQYPALLMKAMRYSLFAKGKRLRPVLLCCACDAMGGSIEQAAPFACAIEMIHTYSLIHDDLPAMDNDDYRRGRLTNHKVFGEDIAILAGDGLLHLAFEIMADAVFKSTDIRQIKAMREIAHASGISGMVAGQVVDVDSEGKEIDENTLFYIHQNKTAAMIKGALVAGAYLGGATQTQVDLFCQAGEKMGLSFQIQDDILDVTSSKEILGKPVLSDEKNHKTTYVTMFGIEQSKAFVEQYCEKAIQIFLSLGDRGAFLAELTKNLIKRDF